MPDIKSIFDSSVQFDSLESIIKVEPEEFQDVTNDELLRLKANM